MTGDEDVPRVIRRYEYPNLHTADCLCCETWAEIDAAAGKVLADWLRKQPIPGATVPPALAGPQHESRRP